LWDHATGKEIRHFETGKDVLGAGLRGRGNCTVVFSLDGKLMATLTSGLAASVVRLWDLAAGKEIHSISGEGFNCLAFAPDGKTLATGNADTTVLIWEVSSVPLAKRELTNAELARLWEELGSEDAAKANRALWSLVAGQKQAVAFLTEK